MEITRRVSSQIIRPEMKKSIWCEGCGLGNLQFAIGRATLRAVSKKYGIDISNSSGLNQALNKVVFVGDIGCNSRMPAHFDFNTLHTTHGRSITFAQGLKVARPDLEVLVMIGDGGNLAIGGNHFIHAGRRNIDITEIQYDNYSYGMTGAQHSPTSPQGEFGTSAPYGVFESPFNVIELAKKAGVTFIAQGAATMRQEYLDQMEKLIEAAILHRGFSFVNILGTCHTGWGKKNKMSEAYECRMKIEEKVRMLEEWKELPDSIRDKYFPIGIIHQETQKPDLLNSPPYLNAIKKAAAKPKTKEIFEEIILPEEPDPLFIYPRISIRIAGSGGHGVVTGGEIVQTALSLVGQKGISLKNYGPEARGGKAFSDVISSQGKVNDPQKPILDYLFALTEESFQAFLSMAAPDGKIIVNSNAIWETYGDQRIYKSKIEEIHSREVQPETPNFGISTTAATVLLSFFDLAPNQAIEDAVMKTVGKKDPVLNRRALNAGFREANRLKGEYQ